MNKEFLQMQKVAGLITESQYKERISENEEVLTYDELLAKYNPEDGPAYVQGLRDEPGFKALSPEKQNYLFKWLRHQQEMDR